MRALLSIAIAAGLLGSCAPRATSVCETRPDGVRLFVDPDVVLYHDVVEALRSNPGRMAASAPAGGEYTSVKAAGPLVCKTGRKFPKTISILYPPRDKRHVSAILDLYLDESGRVEVAEFYVMGLAP